MYRVLFAMLGCQASVALAAFTLPVVAPAAAASLGVPAALVGYYTTVMLVGAMLSTAITGGFVRRYGALRVSQATVVFAGLGLLAMPLAVAGPAALVLLVDNPDRCVVDEEGFRRARAQFAGLVEQMNWLRNGGLTRPAVVRAAAREASSIVAGVAATVAVLLITLGSVL